MSFYFFDYVPFAEAPHPDVAETIEKLGVDYRTENGERLFLETPSSGAIVFAADAGRALPNDAPTARAR